MNEAKQPQSPEVAAAEEIDTFLLTTTGHILQKDTIKGIAAIIARHCRVAEMWNILEDTRDALMNADPDEVVSYGIARHMIRIREYVEANQARAALGTADTDKDNA